MARGNNGGRRPAFGSAARKAQQRSAAAFELGLGVAANPPAGSGITPALRSDPGGRTLRSEDGNLLKPE